MAITARELPSPESVARRVRYARREHMRWSQRELAEATAAAGCPVSEPQIARIEAGQRADLGQLLALATAMGLNVLQLGANSEDYPEMQLFVGAGWDPEFRIKELSGSRWYPNPRPDLRVLPGGRR